MKYFLSRTKTVAEKIKKRKTQLSEHALMGQLFFYKQCQSDAIKAINYLFHNNL